MATVLHGESQSESAGPTRAGFAADPWTVIAPSLPSAALGIKPGDTLTIGAVETGGVELSIQQVSKDPALGWVMRCTSSARAPR